MQYSLFLCLISLSLNPIFPFTVPSGRSQQLPRFSRSKGVVRYEPDSDHHEISYSDSSGVWSALASTEKWIVQTLASSGGATGSNPYTRKEVSYVCEIARESSMVVASLFRRVREARELGESHAEVAKANSIERGRDYTPSTFRQTQIIVIPWCTDAASYPYFDALLQAVNRARRKARDWITDVSSDEQNKIDKELMTVSINIACLHPKFGEKTPKQLLEEMKKEEEDGEIDIHLKEYVQQRNRARQSPFPTFVLELRATPPIVPTQVSSSPSTASDPMKRPENDKPVDSAEIAKLEALFGLPAATKLPMSDMRNDDEDVFYDQLSMAFGDRELASQSPMTLCQGWIASNDPFFNISTSTFTLMDSKFVDAAYEFVFNNIAMHVSTSQTIGGETGSGAVEFQFSSRSYLVMPHFLSSSATSFEKFAHEVGNIVDCLGLRDIVSLSVLHPEHVESERRSPCPILVLQWFNKK